MTGHELIIFASEVAAADGGTNIWNTILQYCIYSAIIVVSIILLIVLRRYSRLPRHGELKKKLVSLSDEIASISAGENRMDFFKSISKAMYKADKLSYTAALMAEKERYSDLSKISACLSQARGELSPYKFGRKEPEEKEGLAEAAGDIARAISLIDGIIERDKKLDKNR